MGKWVVKGIDLGGFGMGWDMEGIEKKKNSPKRSGQWQRQPRRRGWIAAERF